MKQLMSEIKTIYLRVTQTFYPSLL